MMPPSTSALCILFSRNHNYICEKLLEINEKGTFTKPPPSEQKAKDKQDEDLFQTARLINSGFFMQTILSDYLVSYLAPYLPEGFFQVGRFTHIFILLDAVGCHPGSSSRG